jgi:hypothetical protein
LTDRLGDVRARLAAAGWDTCAVVSDERVVLGLLHEAALAADPGTVAETVMAPGPTTYRPDASPAQLAKHLREHEGDGVLVTTPDGRLVGFVWRADAEQAERAQGAGRSGAGAG